MNTAKVGILIRTKNRPLCLERAIKKILQQTFHKWHIYILNDGGDIRTIKQIIDKYSVMLDGRISLHNNTNSVGRGQAASQLISLSSEEYILIHDDDDTIEDRFLEKTTSFLDDERNKNCTAVVVSNYDVFEEIDGNQIKTLGRHDEFGKRQSNFIDFLSYLSSDIAIIPICILFKRSTIYLSGNINPNLNYMEDYDFFTRLLFYGEFGVIVETLASYHHRVDNNSEYDTTRTIMQNGYHDLYFNQKLRKYISGNDTISNLICTMLVNKRNRDYIINSNHINHLEVVKLIQLLANSIKLLNEKIDNLNVEGSKSR